MTDDEATGEPISGWPGAPVPGPEGAGSPQDPTTPFPGSPSSEPPAAAPTPPGFVPPASYPPPNAPPAPGGYAAPNVPPAPGGYASPSVPPAPGAYGAPPGYAPPGYAPPAGYGYGPGGAYGGYPAPRDHPQGTTILVLGILSIVVCGILGPFAWSMGNKALREIDRNPAAYSNRGNVQAGRIIGMVATIILGVVIAIYGVLLLVVIFAGSTSS